MRPQRGSDARPALGLSAVLASSALAFNLLKYAGAGYLIWLGYRKLTRTEESATEARPKERSLWRVFRQGVQFVDPSRGAVAFQFAFLGGVFIVIALCTDMTWCLLASGAISTAFSGHGRT